MAEFDVNGYKFTTTGSGRVRVSGPGIGAGGQLDLGPASDLNQAALISAISSPNLTPEARAALQDLAPSAQTIGSNLQAQRDAPRSSAGDIAGQAQRANDDGANAVAPSAVPNPNQAITNADRFDETPNTDTNTDAATRSLTTTQSIPPITASPGAIPGQAQTDAFAFDDQPQPGTTTTQAGVGAAKEDQTGGTGSGIRAALNQRFAGNIVPQGNVLDQYASYTYAISIYLMSAADYKQLVANPNNLPRGSQLILQSGGAPVGGGLIPGADLDPNIEDPGQAGQAQRANLTRNEFFSLDYYLDDVRLTSVISGKGTNMAHNVTRLQFKVIEPNGITFLDNLYRATDQYVKLSGTPQVNYAAQTYLMIIRFYGYDKDGNLVLTQNQPFTNPLDGKRIDTVVEKYIPFQFTGIRFRVANKMVEYDCDCVAVSNNVASSPARGVIPYNVELTSQTLKDLLGGQAQFARSAPSGDGRPVAAPPTGAGVRPPDNSGLLGSNTPNNPFLVGP